MNCKNTLRCYFVMKFVMKLPKKKKRNRKEGRLLFMVENISQKNRTNCTKFITTHQIILTYNKRVSNSSLAKSKSKSKSKRESNRVGSEIESNEAEQVASGRHYLIDKQVEDECRRTGARLTPATCYAVRHMHAGRRPGRTH